MNKKIDSFYVNLMNANNLLNEFEEKDLLLNVRNNNDEQAKNKLIASNMKLVCDIANKYTYGNNDINDLIEEGLIALSKAINSYNDENIKFSTLAYTCIERAIKRYINNNQLVHIPEKKYKAVKEVENVINNLKESLGYMPSISEIKANLSNPKDYEVYETFYGSVLSLDNPVDDDEKTNFIDLFASETIDYEARLDKANVLKAIDDVFNSDKFSKFEKDCFNLYKDGFSVSSIAKSMKCSVYDVKCKISKVKDVLSKAALAYC